MRGTIISLKPLQLLPTFSYACDYNPTFLRLYAKHLAPLGFSLPLNGTYRATPATPRCRARAKSSSGNRPVKSFTILMNVIFRPGG